MMVNKMNPAMAHWHTTASPASPRLLAGCLLASVAAHALLLAVLPGWWRFTVPEVPAAIDVLLMPVDVPAAVAAPAPSHPPASSSAVKSRAPAPVVHNAAATPARTEIAVPATSADAALPAVVEPAHPSIAVSAVPAAARAAPAPTTTPAFDAAYLRNPPPRYPPAARRSGDQGTVLLRVLVSADGAAAQVELDRSSGSSLLDGAALDAVRGWRFVPARRGVQNIADWVQVPVVFRLES